MQKPIKIPDNKIGIGLRACHYATILETLPNVTWFEALADNYLNDPHQQDFLQHIRQHYPITLHCVGMSLGSTDPLNMTYLKQLKILIQQVQPSYVSEHLSWSSVKGQHLHDLLPLPMNQDCLSHISTRIRQVQDYLGCQLLIENPSSYIKLNMDTMPEWDFLNQLAEQADCFILLDINNLYVSACNQKFNAQIYLKNINPSRVKQYHLAGYTDMGDFLFDQHSQDIHPPVWSLYAAALKILGARPTLIERDDNIPPLDILLKEAQQADQIIQQTTMQHV